MRIYYSKGLLIEQWLLISKSDQVGIEHFGSVTLMEWMRFVQWFKMDFSKISLLLGIDVAADENGYDEPDVDLTPKKQQVLEEFEEYLVSSLS